MTKPAPMIFRCATPGCKCEHRSDRGHIVGASREIGELGWRILRQANPHGSFSLTCPKHAEELKEGAPP